MLIKNKCLLRFFIKLFLKNIILDYIIFSKIIANERENLFHV